MEKTDEQRKPTDIPAGAARRTWPRLRRGRRGARARALGEGGPGLAHPAGVSGATGAGNCQGTQSCRWRVDGSGNRATLSRRGARRGIAGGRRGCAGAHACGAAPVSGHRRGRHEEAFRSNRIEEVQPRLGKRPGAEEWTSGGGGSTRDRAKQKKPAPEDIPAKKQRFVDDHMADAQNGADKLGIPVENILGLSALESGWGKGRFAAEGQNYFGLHAPSPFQTGTIQATKTKRKVEVATFRSYADSLNSFIARYGSLIRGVSDPQTFARLLQNTGSFGVDEDGRKRPEYVPDVDATI